MSEPLCCEKDCGHKESSHFSCEAGSFCKECPIENHQWEHLFKAPQVAEVRDVKAPPPKVFFYGCLCGVNGRTEAGHYWYSTTTERGGQCYDAPVTPFGRYPDGTLAPDEKGKTASSNYRGQPQGLVKLTQMGGWTAIGFWDRTGDSRGNSNSNFIVRGEFSFDQMCQLAQAQYPELWKRFGTVRLMQDGE